MAMLEPDMLPVNLHVRHNGGMVVDHATEQTCLHIVLFFYLILKALTLIASIGAHASSYCTLNSEKIALV